jgi:hypothetical protein
MTLPTTTSEFYSIYLTDHTIQLRLERGSHKGLGRCLSTQKSYQAAWECAQHLANYKQIPFINYVDSSGCSKN